MKPSSLIGLFSRLRIPAAMICVAVAPAAFGQQVTFTPYLQLGDNGTLGATDQIVVAWQTDETAPNSSAYKVEFSAGEHDGRSVNPSARVIDNYLAADPALPAIPGAYGAHTNYTAVLHDLRYDTVYQYRVTGPGMPDGGFASSFRTRKRKPVFSFAVEGDEGFFPVVPNANPPRVVDYEARIAHLIYNAANISLPNEPSRPEPDFILNTGDNVYNVGSEDSYRDSLLSGYKSNKMNWLEESSKSDWESWV
jgi:Purple acid Phosphatase, N-terminal domain